MLIPINKVVKELDLKPYQLHTWEKNGWLGTEPVLKDSSNNNQRIYTVEQVERIEYIKKIMDEQKEQGIKRTNIQEMNEKLLEKFGGEIIEIERNELSDMPASFEEFKQIMITQNKQMSDIKDIVKQLAQVEHKDHSEDFQHLKDELFYSRQREEKLMQTIEKSHELIESLQKQVQDLSKELKEERKKNIIQKLFGG